MNDNDDEDDDATSSVRIMRAREPGSLESPRKLSLDPH